MAAGAAQAAGAEGCDAGLKLAEHLQAVMEHSMLEAHSITADLKLQDQEQGWTSGVGDSTLNVKLQL